MSTFESRFLLQEVVGRGRLGELHLALQRDLGRKVAVRVVSPEVMNSQEAREKLSRGLEALGRVRASCLVATVASGTVEGRRAYAMERVEGWDVARLAGGDDAPALVGPAETVDRVRSLRQLIETLQALQAEGVDPYLVRASEVIIVPPFRFVLAEPGLAGLVGEKPGSRPSSAFNLPEALRNAVEVTCDPAWDIGRGAVSRTTDLALNTSAIRGRIFADLSVLSAREPGEVLDRALAFVTSWLEEHGTAIRTLDEPPSSSGSSRLHLLRRYRRFAFFVILIGSLLVGGALFGYGFFGLRPLAPNRFLEAELDQARRDRDFSAALDLARRADLRPDPTISEEIESLLHELRNERVDAVLDRGLDVILSRGSPTASELMPADESARLGEPYVREVERELTALRLRARDLAIFEDNAPLPELLGIFDRLVQLRSREELSPRAFRVLMLRLLEHEKPEVARRAAAAIAALLAEAPPHLDHRIAHFLIDANTEPTTRLPLLGYLGQLTQERASEHLARVVLLPGNEHYAPNPHQDRWLNDFLGLDPKTDSVLQSWLGMPKSYRGHGQIRLRIAALFALEHSGSPEAVPIAAALLSSGDVGLASAGATVLGRRPEVPMERLEEEYSRRRKLPGHRVRLALLGAMKRRDPERAVEIALEDLADGALGRAYKQQVLQFLVAEKLIPGPKTLRRLLKVTPHELLRNLARMSEKHPVVSESLDGLLDDPESLGPVELAASITAGFLGLNSEVVYETLTASLQDQQASLAARDWAMRSLASTKDDRAIGAILRILSSSEPVALRSRALALSAQLLGQQPSLQQTYRVPVGSDDQGGERILRALASTTMLDESRLLRHQAAAVLSGYQNPIILHTFRRILEEPDDISLVRAAARHFRQQASQGDLDLEVVERLMPVFTRLLHDEDIDDEGVRQEVLAFLGALRLPEAVPHVLRELDNIQELESRLLALNVLSIDIDNPGVQARILELLESYVTTTELVALLEMAREAGFEAPIETYREILDEEEDPGVLFAVANALHDAGESLDTAVLLDIYRMYLEDTATGPEDDYRSTGSEYAILPEGLRGPRLLRQVELDLPEFADWLKDQDLEDVALTEAVGLLLVHLARSGAGPDRIRDTIAAAGLEIGQLITALEQSSGGDRFGRDPSLPEYLGPFPFSEFRTERNSFVSLETIDTLCRAYPDEAGPYKLRAVWSSYLLGEGTADRIQGACRDLETAIRLGSPARKEILLGLAWRRDLVDDVDGAIAYLETYREENPYDLVGAFRLFDILVRLDRTAEAHEILERTVGRRRVPPPDAWGLHRRLIQLDLKTRDWPRLATDVSRVVDDEALRSDGAKLLDLLAPVAEAMVLDPDLSQSQPDLKSRLVDLCIDVMHYDLSWRARLRAARHLGDLLAEEGIDALHQAIQGDRTPEVRREALLSLHRLDPQAALGPTRERAEKDPNHELRFACMWILHQHDPKATLAFLQKWLPELRGGDAPYNAPIAGIALDFAADQAIAQLLPRIRICMEHHPVPAIRLRAVQVVRCFASRGHSPDREALWRSARYDRDSSVRDAATDTLVSLGDGEALTKTWAHIERFLQLPSMAVRARLSETPNLQRALVRLHFARDPKSRDLLDRFIDVETRAAQSRLDAECERHLDRARRSGGGSDWGAAGDTLARAGRFSEAKSAYAQARDLDLLGREDWERKLGLVSYGICPFSIDESSSPHEALEVAQTTLEAIRPVLERAALEVGVTLDVSRPQETARRLRLLRSDHARSALSVLPEWLARMVFGRSAFEMSRWNLDLGKMALLQALQAALDPATNLVDGDLTRRVVASLDRMDSRPRPEELRATLDVRRSFQETWPEWQDPQPDPADGRRAPPPGSGDADAWGSDDPPPTAAPDPDSMSLSRVLPLLVPLCRPEPDLERLSREAPSAVFAAERRELREWWARCVE